MYHDAIENCTFKLIARSPIMSYLWCFIEALCLLFRIKQPCIFTSDIAKTMGFFVPCIFHRGYIFFLEISISFEGGASHDKVV